MRRLTQCLRRKEIIVVEACDAFASKARPWILKKLRDGGVDALKTTVRATALARSSFARGGSKGERRDGDWTPEAQLSLGLRRIERRVSRRRLDGEQKRSSPDLGCPVAL